MRDEASDSPSDDDLNRLLHNHKARNAGQAMTAGVIGLGARQSLREEIHRRLQGAQEGARDASKLDILRQRIDKHPETFEMISLMKELHIL